jgi:hypothetical protein
VAVGAEQTVALVLVLVDIEQMLLVQLLVVERQLKQHL